LPQAHFGGVPLARRQTQKIDLTLLISMMRLFHAKASLF
jgi:hypothetical protein